MASDLHGNAALAQSRRLVGRLCELLAPVECVETHSSWVLLTEAHVYKIKKPLRLDFLDFSTLPLRRRACEEELRINRRTAPGLYLGVLPITGSIEQPVMGGTGQPLEWAVYMLRFPPGAELSAIADRGELQARHIDRVVRQVANLHAGADRADAPGPLGRPELLLAQVADNFRSLSASLAGDPLGGRLAALEGWASERGQHLAPLMRARREAGRVRECHGDLHLGNIAWVDGDALLFDALEFDPALRWVDAVADFAFLFMDLHQIRRSELAWRALNGWLDLLGDHGALPLLDFCAAYRALVRAKVTALRVQERGDAHHQEVQRYLELAE